MKKILAIISLVLVLIFSSSCATLDYTNNNNSNGKVNSTIQQLSYDLVSRDDKEILSGSEIYKKVAPSMVSVINVVNGTQQSEGSGFVIAAEGVIVTNAHVVEGADSLLVYINDEEQTQLTTEVFWYDTYTDLAIVKVDAGKDLIPVELGDSTEMEVGEEVYALGNPGGSEFKYSLTKGIISNVNILYSPIQGALTINCFLVDAAINPGNSGGTLINNNGQVIGINSAKIVSDGFENMGFSIYINEAKPIIEDLVSKHTVSGRPALGITYSAETNVWGSMIGIRIASIYKESGLNDIDISVGDIITKIDDYNLTSPEQIAKAISGKVAEDTIRLTYYKDSEDYKIQHESNVTLIDAEILNQ